MIYTPICLLRASPRHLNSTWPRPLSLSSPQLLLLGFPLRKGYHHPCRCQSQKPETHHTSHIFWPQRAYWFYLLNIMGILLHSILSGLRPPCLFLSLLENWKQLPYDNLTSILPFSNPSFKNITWSSFHCYPILPLSHPHSWDIADAAYPGIQSPSYLTLVFCSDWCPTSSAYCPLFHSSAPYSPATEMYWPLYSFAHTA